MHKAVSIFPTDASITPADLAVACEERGFESLWVAEHSHIPVSRKTPFPGGGDLPKMYYDVMDPFVCLASAATVTKRLKVATGVCLLVAAGSDPDGKTGRDARSHLERPVPVRNRRRLERRGDGEPRHGLRSAASGCCASASRR